MELIKRQRIRFTIATTLIAAIFLLVLFGAYFALTAVNGNVFVSRVADKAIAEYSVSGEPAQAGAKVLAIEVNEYGDYTTSGDVSSFKDIIGETVVKAVEIKEGKFNIGDRYFFVKRAALTGGNTLYVVVERSEQHTQMVNTALQIALLYLCAIAIAALVGFLASAKMLLPVAQAFTTQRDLITNASHELKTPLTVISANMSVIKSEPTSTVQDNAYWIESIDSQIERMQGLIQNMLELSKLEQAQLRTEWLDLSVLVDCACLTFEPVCFEKNVEMVADITPNICLMGEKDSLERLVTILLDNASKYCGEKGKIGIRLDRDSKRAKLSVMNTGEVISKEDAQHVFDRFFRADGARKNDDGRSFGLGLSIAAATVKAHGGTITCHGIDGKGTVFTVTLPIKKPREKKQHPARLKKSDKK